MGGKIQGVNPGQESFVWLSRTKWAQILPVFWHLWKWGDLFQSPSSISNMKRDKCRKTKSLDFYPRCTSAREQKQVGCHAWNSTSICGSCGQWVLTQGLGIRIHPVSKGNEGMPDSIIVTHGYLNPAPIVQLLKWQIKIPSDRCQHPLFPWDILSLFCLLCNFWSL